MKTIYYHGRVFTGSLPLVEAFAVEGKRFWAAGTLAEVEAACFSSDETSADSITRIDLQNRFVCCGFEDSHIHVLNYGAALASVELGPHTDSLADMIAEMKRFLALHPKQEGEWLMARGWNQDYFTDVDRYPTRFDLDLVSTQIPICATRCCGHALVLNSKALEILELQDASRVLSMIPEGGSAGTLQRGEETMLDGTFFDNAFQLLDSKLPVPTRETVKQYILSACKALNAVGTTSCHSDDFATFDLPWQEVMEAFRELEEEGSLTLRIYEQSNMGSLENLKDLVEAGYTTGTGTDLFRIGPLKMVGDGSLGARTAYLSLPYADDASQQGFPCYTQEEFDSMIAYANEHQMQVAIHAIGDGCVDMVLDAIEKALAEHPRDDHRHGIVHCQITRADQLKRMAKLNLHIYAQTIFLDYDIHIVQYRVGADLASTSYSWKTLMKQGLSVSNGCDCPVEIPDPLPSIQCAVTRTTLKDHIGPYLPDQAFTVEEAIQSYTIRSAEASFEEDYKGLIAPGYLADFVILDQDPFGIDPSQIAQIHVLATYLGGDKVYDALNL